MSHEEPREEPTIAHHRQFVRSGLVGLALGVGLAGLAGGCGGTGGSDTPTQGEKVPEGIVQMKNAMKERAAAKKGRPSGPRRGPGGP